MKRPIPVAKPEIGESELQAVTQAVKEGWVSSKGHFIEEFEHDFSEYIGAKHGVAVSNGTAALHLAAIALDLDKRAEVVMPTLSYIAAANAIGYTGAKPVFADSNAQYWCIDPESIAEKVTKRTKAILVVHLYGHPCDMGPILEMAEDHDLRVIEDCAEAHGAEYKGRKVGSMSDVSCFSFYGNKIITTGEGGMCLTNEEHLAQRIRLYRNQGMTPGIPYRHEVIGYNYRMTNLQAALGVAQLQRIETLIAKKRRIAQIYSECLRHNSDLTCPSEMPWAKHVYWLYSVLFPNHDIRQKVADLLNQQAIETRPFFYPIHMQGPYNEDLHLPVAENLSGRGLNLPSGPSITEEDLGACMSALRGALELAAH